MKQVFFYNNRVLVEEIPAPIVGPGEILVEVAYSLISSGTERSSLGKSTESVIQQTSKQSGRASKVIEYVRNQGIQKTMLKVRETMLRGHASGYSCSGIVIEVGKGISDIKPGDRVACGGATANHAGLVSVPRNLLVKVPNNCSLQDAASTTIGAISLQGIRRADAHIGDTVAVIGLGLLGQLTVQLLKASGCRVIGFDLDAKRVCLAQLIGADYAWVSSEVNSVNEVRHITNGYGADIVIITAATQSDSVAQMAMEITRKKGRIVLVGDVGLGLKRSPFYEKEIDFLISCSYGPGRYDPTYELDGIDYPFPYVRWTENRNMAEYLRLVTNGQIQLENIIEHVFPVEDAEKAYGLLGNSDNRPLAIMLSYEHKIANQVVQRVAQISTKKLGSQIQVAVIGAGNFARSMHLPNLQKLSKLYHIRAIVSHSGNNAKNTAKLFDAEYATTDLQQVLNDPKIDAIIICTRHNLHTNQTIASLNAGKAVFVEKPLCISSEELLKLLGYFNLSYPEINWATLTNNQPVLTVGYNRRFSPPIIQLRSLVEKRQNPLMIVYRVNAGYVPPTAWVHGMQGGGRLIGEACHMVDTLRFLVGSPVRKATVVALVPHSEHILASDNTSLTIEYEDGSVCNLIYTSLGNDGVGKEYLEAFWDNKIAILDDFKTLHIKGIKGKDWHSSHVDKGHCQALEAFAHGIQNGSWPISLPELIETTQITLEASKI